MRPTRASRKSRKLNYDRLGMIVIVAVVTCLLGWLYFSSSQLKMRLSVYNARTQTLQEEIELEEERTKEIAALREYMTTDEYMEEVAREKLGLVKENEIVFEESK